MIEALSCNLVVELTRWTFGPTLVAHLNQSLVR